MENRKHIFTPMEKKYFIEIVKKYKAIVENKETDGASLRNKSETWHKIAAEYNASPHASTQATTKQLRRLWMNIKQRQREALTKQRQQRLATGRGPSISDAIDPLSEVFPAPKVEINTAIDSDADLETAPTGSPERRPTALTGQRNNDSILEREYKDRQMRANEKHKVEIKILQEQLREAKAKAELAELILRQRLL